MFTNIAAYKFASLNDLKSLRQSLLAECKTLNLKGTILLAPEGINMFIAGADESIEKLLSFIRSIPGLEDLTPKYSYSEHQPFNRMLVRLKKEIISFGVDGINPANYTSKKLPPKELKAWLDQGKPITLLDTRNDYEIKLGTFKNAYTLPIDHFRQFPEAVRKLPAEMKHQPIVMFCTGGIRCEKAGPFMEQEGFTNIYQLEGGILKYFEEVGGKYYEGECFVFDQRVGVDPALRETPSAVCFSCQTPLNQDEVNDPRYQPGQTCPYCYRSTEEQIAERLTASRQRLREVSAELPGSVPHDNYRPLNIPAHCDGLSLLDALCSIFPHIGREQWLLTLEQGSFVDQNHQPVSGSITVRAGDRFARVQRNVVEPAVNADIGLIYEDEAILVINKPAPLPMHPAGRYHLNTLQNLLNIAFEPRRIRAAHRLDADTTGVLLCTTTRHFAKILQPQFQRNEVEKVYLTKVLGHPQQDHFSCDLHISDEPGPAGSRKIDETESGLAAHTDFKVLDRYSDGTALLEVHPITGRTNQIRVHLAHLGYPIVGDPTYQTDRVQVDTNCSEYATSQTLEVNAPPLCLHSYRITFNHPLTKERLTFEAPPPKWIP